MGSLGGARRSRAAVPASAPQPSLFAEMVQAVSLAAVSFEAPGNTTEIIVANTSYIIDALQTLSGYAVRSASARVDKTGQLFPRELIRSVIADAVHLLFAARTLLSSPLHVRTDVASFLGLPVSPRVTVAAGSVAPSPSDKPATTHRSNNSANELSSALYDSIRLLSLAEVATSLLDGDDDSYVVNSMRAASTTAPTLAPSPRPSHALAAALQRTPAILHPATLSALYMHTVRRFAVARAAAWVMSGGDACDAPDDTDVAVAPLIRRVRGGTGAAGMLPTYLECDPVDALLGAAAGDRALIGLDEQDDLDDAMLSRAGGP